MHEFMICILMGILHVLNISASSYVKILFVNLKYKLDLE